MIRKIMSKKLSKGLSLLLVFCMMITLLPAEAMAAEMETDPAAVVLEDDADPAEASVDQTGEAVTDPAEEETAEAEEPAAKTPAEEAPADPETPAEEPASPETPAEEAPVSPETPAKEDPAAKDPTAETPADAATPAEEELTEEVPAVEDPTALTAPAEEPIVEEEPAVFSSVEVLKSARATSGDGFYKIVHLDCGRKYFSVDSITALIDLMAKNDYNQLELAVGNAGLRFLLDDMEIKVSDDVSYKSDDVKAAVKEGNKTQNSSDDDRYLTEDEMTEIIQYAKEKKIQIVPLLNMPGHMNALLNVNPDYKLPDKNSKGETTEETLDLNDPDAYAFGLAVLQKYVDYFADQGVLFFNFGADEYANDIYNPYFSMQGATVNYDTLVDYINDCAQIIINAGMTPRAFNDFIYYGNESGVSKDIQVCYWSNQWDGSPYASASALEKESYTLINTSSDWYYVPGVEGYSLEKATGNMKENGYSQFKDGSTGTASGTMVCIWSDKPNAAEETDVLSAADTLISTFAAKNSAQFTVQSESGGDNTGVQEKEINVTVNGTYTDTIEGGDYSEDIDSTKLNTTIATVTAAGTTTAGGKELKEVTSIESGKKYLIFNPHAKGLLTDTANSNRLTLAGAVSADSGEVWTITSTENGYSVQNASGSYLTIGDGTSSVSQSSATLALNYANGTWTISRTNQNNTYYLCNYQGKGTAGGWKTTAKDAVSDDGCQWKIYEVVDNADTPATEVTITGVSVGDTEVTVGNTHYTIHVVNEDLNAAGTKDILYRITNTAVTGEDENTSKTVSAADVYGKNGKAISELVPAAGTYVSEKNTYNVKYWKTQYLTGDDRLPKDGAWSNCSDKGTTITHIRYYGGQWEVKNTAGTWITVDPESDIVAYYLHKTDVTKEVTTYVVDWGDSWDLATTIYNTYGFYDFAVVYPSSSDRNPGDFGNSHTMLFNTDAKGDYAIDGGRYVHEVQAEASEDYEVYMITAIRVGFDTQLKDNNIPTYTDSYKANYDTAEEKIIWVDDESSIPSGMEMTKYDGYYHVGGEPTIPRMELYHRQAILFTYYLRVKPNEDSLTVHYVDETADFEFHKYNISVNEGNVFDEDIKLDDPTWKGPLVNGTVINTVNVPETVTADLSQMTEIGAQYRYSDYECRKVVRSEDGKDVYLYYTFKNTHSFVVDFGLPLQITTKDLKIEDGWDTISVTGGAQYGTAEASKEGVITYTPTKVLEGVVDLQLTLGNTGNTGSTASHQIYIYPATTVYYEEGFASSTGFTGGRTGTDAQATQVAGKSSDEYGYDAKYAGEANGPSNGTQAVSTTKGDKATFTFTGRGLDIYTNNTTTTGYLMVQVKNSSGSTVKLMQVDTAMKVAEEEDDRTDATAGQAVTAYNVPVVSLTDLTYGEYTAILTNIKGGTVNLDGFRVYGTLKNQANEAYTNDSEDNPVFIELRDRVLASMNPDFKPEDPDSGGVDSSDSKQYASQIARNMYSQVYATAGTTAGVVITSKPGTYTDATLTDLLDNGPKNEIYLQKDQAVTFKLNTNREVQVGLKALNAPTTCTVNEESKTLTTSTDMFYTVLNATEVESPQTVTITNNGDGILAITKVKVCDDPAAAFASLTEEDLIPALESLGIEKDPGTDEPDPEPVYADATLTVAVADADGKELASTALTANGVEGESAVFAADEIKAAVEALALPEDYELEDASYSDVTVAYGETDSVSFTAVKEEAIEPTPTPDPEPTPDPTPEEPTTVIGKIVKVIKNIFNRIFGW